MGFINKEDSVGEVPTTPGYCERPLWWPSECLVTDDGSPVVDVRRLFARRGPGAGEDTEPPVDETIQVTPFSRQKRQACPAISLWQRIFRVRQRSQAGALCERYGRGSGWGLLASDESAILHDGEKGSDLDVFNQSLELTSKGTPAET